MMTHLLCKTVKSKSGTEKEVYNFGIHPYILIKIRQIPKSPKINQKDLIE